MVAVTKTTKETVSTATVLGNMVISYFARKYKGRVQKKYEKSNHDYFWGRGGQPGSMITFYFLFFFVPYILKLISGHTLNEKWYC